VSARVELFGIARARAGVAEAEVEADSLGGVLRALAGRFPNLEGEVIRDGALAEGWLVSLDGERFVDDPATPVPDGATLLLITAHAGG
jgi:molybdopterin converting factor small subunit